MSYRCTCLLLLFSALAACAPVAEPVTFAQLDRQLSPDLTAAQCMAVLGPPTHDFGAAEQPIYQYTILEGGYAMLSFSPTLESAIYSIPGKISQQLFPK